MKEPRIKAVEPPMRMADEPPIEAEAAVEYAEPSWPQPIDTAPHDGAIVLVSADGAERAACWHTTRVRNFAQRRWDVTGWWTDPVTAQKLTFEPTEWRPASGFATQPVAAE